METSSVVSENKTLEVRNDPTSNNDVTSPDKNASCIAEKDFEVLAKSETKNDARTSLEFVGSVAPHTVHTATNNKVDRNYTASTDSEKIASGDESSKSLCNENLCCKANSSVSIERNTGTPIRKEMDSSPIVKKDEIETSTLLLISESSSTQSLSRVNVTVDDSMEHESNVNEKIEDSVIQDDIRKKQVVTNGNNEDDIEMSSTVTEKHLSPINKTPLLSLMRDEQSIVTSAQDSKSNETVTDEQMTVDDVSTQESHIQKAIETNPVLLRTNEQTDVNMSSSPSQLSDAQLPLTLELAENASTLEKNLPKSTEMCVAKTVKRDAKFVNGKTPEKRSSPVPLTSLAVIASAYDTSDSESEEEVNCVYEEKNDRSNAKEMEVQITKIYRNKTADISDEESDSEDSSSSSAVTSSSSEDESDESDESDENHTESKNSKKKNEKSRNYRGSQEKESKGEFDNLPPIEDLKISVPEVLCDPLGEVGWMVEQMVVVRPKPGKPTLNLDTILFVERGRRVLGRIFDVFGQVSEPHYCVRFNSTDHIKESDIKVGMTVYFCPNTEYTSVVFLQDLLKMKVTDELGDDEHPEFSDDEEERAYYAALKKKENAEKANSGSEVPQKRQRTAAQEPAWKSNHPWSSGRKQQQPGKNYNTPDWSGGQQQTACHPPNMWHYPSAYPNNPWPPGPQAYQGNAWPAACPQNPYGYSEQYRNRHPRGNARSFFRPPQSFHSGPNPYMQSGPYAQQSNPVRYPAPNFPWRSQSPRQPGVAWPVAPPPPPPPPGM